MICGTFLNGISIRKLNSSVFTALRGCSALGPKLKKKKKNNTLHDRGVHAGVTDTQRKLIFCSVALFAKTKSATPMQSPFKMLAWVNFVTRISR